MYDRIYFFTGWLYWKCEVNFEYCQEDYARGILECWQNLGLLAVPPSYVSNAQDVYRGGTMSNVAGHWPFPPFLSWQITPIPSCIIVWAWFVVSPRCPWAFHAGADATSLCLWARHRLVPVLGPLYEWSRLEDICPAYRWCVSTCFSLMLCIFHFWLRFGLGFRLFGVSLLRVNRL